jgi:sulfotransferase
MDNGIHFISGLPRSGSTLLAAILRQNPRLHAGMSSPLAVILNQIIAATGAQHDHSVFLTDEQRRDIVRSIFDAYYRRIHPERTVFDTSRIWCGRLPALAELFPQSRVIACVRNPAWIIDSFERLYRKNPFLASKMFNAQTGATVYTRVDYLTSRTGVVGFAIGALGEAFHGDQADRLLIVDYEALAREPRFTIERIYDFLQLAPFTHDFENVAFEGGREYDIKFGMPGLHEVERKVRYSQRETILPPDIFNRFSQSQFWKRDVANTRRVPVILPETSRRGAGVAGSSDADDPRDFQRAARDEGQAARVAARVAEHARTALGD